MPLGPGEWEYDSTTRYLGQLGDAMGDISEGFADLDADAGITLPKRFADIRLLMTRETWKRARQSFHRAYDEFRDTVLASWKAYEMKEAAE